MAAKKENTGGCDNLAFLPPCSNALQIALRASSNERMQIAAFALIPLVSLILGRRGDVEE